MTLSLQEKITLSEARIDKAREFITLVEQAIGRLKGEMLQE